MSTAFSPVRGDTRPPAHFHSTTTLHPAARSTPSTRARQIHDLRIFPGVTLDRQAGSSNAWNRLTSDASDDLDGSFDESWRPRRLSGTEPVKVKIENGGHARECIERRNRNAMAPKLHIAFAYVEPPGGASGADAGPSQGCIQASGKSAPQAAVPVATLKVLDGLSASIHVFDVSQDCFYRRWNFFPTRFAKLPSHFDNFKTDRAACVR